jgi:SAM-dependent methyltransferase
MLLGAGATKAHALERFDTLRPAHEQRAIYSKLAERHGIELRHPVDALPDGIEWHQDVRQRDFFSHHLGAYDAIFSTSVMEHVGNPLLLLDQVGSALVPGGITVHIIDLADHGMLGDNRHPLEFLTIPRPIYRRMIANSGRPNRVQCHEYRKFAASAGRRAEVLVRRLIKADELPVALPFEEIDSSERSRAIRMVREIRPRLAEEFKSVSDEDLAVQEIVFVGGARLS